MIQTLYEPFRHWSDGGSLTYYLTYILMMQIASI